MAWLLSIFEIIKVILVTVVGIRAGSLDADMGFNLYILNCYIPMLIVTHYLIIKTFLRK